MLFKPEAILENELLARVCVIAFAPEGKRGEVLCYIFGHYFIEKSDLLIKLTNLNINLRNQFADVQMSISNEWFVAVFKCNSLCVKKTLVEFYRFVDDLKGVRSLHFLIRDRIEDEVVFSFRVMVEPKFKEIIKSKASSKLRVLLAADKFALDPTAESDLARYVAWSPEKRIEDSGQSKFNLFIDLLKNMSAIVIQMIENDYFASSERVELAHVVVWMLGYTEYGLLSPYGIEVGYYDRLCDKYSSYLRQDFPKTEQ